MESPIKRLRQRRATLGAQQGDPEAPASGTLFARRNKLLSELEQVLHDQRLIARGRVPDGVATAALHTRSAAALRRQLRTIEGEIESVQLEIDEIDKQIGEAEQKVRA